MRRLRGNLSGLAQPTYILDIPGGHGKVPVGPGYLRETGDGTEITDPSGRTHPTHRRTRRDAQALGRLNSVNVQKAAWALDEAGWTTSGSRRAAPTGSCRTPPTGP